MVGKSVLVLCAAMLAAGCGEQDQSDPAQSSNDLMGSAETRTDASQALNREQALALMKERHDHMETLGRETKRINNQLKSTSPNIGQIRQSAARILQHAPDLATWFPQGTGPETGKTHARPEIWQRRDDFEAKAHQFVQSAERFDSAAKSGDLGQVEASFAELGKSCKGCHDLYRTKDD